MAPMRSLRRLRAPTAFARLTLVALALLWVIVPSGAVVRLTASGLGLPGLAALRRRRGARRGRPRDDRVQQPRALGARRGGRRVDLARRPAASSAPRAALRRWSAAVAVATVGQVPLGAITVLSGLHPLAVGSHFLLSMAALAGGTFLALCGPRLVQGRERGWDRRRGPLAAAVAVAAGGAAGHRGGRHRRRAALGRRRRHPALGATCCWPTACTCALAVVFAVLAAVLVAWVWREGGVDSPDRPARRARPAPGGAADRDRRVPVPPRAAVGGGGAARDHRRPGVGRDPGGLSRGGPPGPGAGSPQPGGHPLAGDAADGVRQRAAAVPPGSRRRSPRRSRRSPPRSPRGRPQARLALLPAQLLAQVALPQVGVGRGLGRVVVRVAALLAVAGEVALLERGHDLLAQPAQPLRVILETGLLLGHRPMVASAQPLAQACREGSALASAGCSDGEVTGCPRAPERTALRSRPRGSSGSSRATSGPLTGWTWPSRGVRCTASWGRTAPARAPACGCCATLLRPTGGRALVAGHDVVREAGAVRRSIGVALQDAAIDPYMTGRELLHLQAVLHGFPRAPGPAARGRAARAGRPGGRGRPARGHLLRRHAPAPRSGAGAGARAGGAVPGRAHHRARPHLPADPLDRGPAAQPRVRAPPCS